MRDWAWFVRRSIWALGLGLAIFAACDDSSETTRPLDFGYFVHPGALDAGSPGAVRAGVYVGGSACWHLGGSSLDRQGNRLILSGYAVREAGPSLCPLRRVYAELEFTIPALEAGRYVIEAGDLADTLEVASPAPRPAGKFFAAHGTMWSPDGTCILFGSPSYPGSEEIAGIVPPFPNPEWPPLPWDVRVAGSVAGADTCAGSERSLLHLRGLTLEAQ